MPAEIKIGTRVRAFTYDGVRLLVGEAADFIEGRVVAIPIIAGTLKYQIQVDRVVCKGEEAPVSTDNDTAFVVANGTDLGFGKVSNSVEPVEDAITILIKRRQDDYQALTADNSAVWGCGKNPDEAIGDLIQSWPERFGIKIDFQVSEEDPCS